MSGAQDTRSDLRETGGNRGQDDHHDGDGTLVPEAPPLSNSKYPATDDTKNFVSVGKK